jgi:hypothetical protein
VPGVGTYFCVLRARRCPDRDGEPGVRQVSPRELQHPLFLRRSKTAPRLPSTPMGLPRTWVNCRNASRRAVNSSLSSGRRLSMAVIGPHLRPTLRHYLIGLLVSRGQAPAPAPAPARLQAFRIRAPLQSLGGSHWCGFRKKHAQDSQSVPRRCLTVVVRHFHHWSGRWRGNLRRQAAAGVCTGPQDNVAAAWLPHPRESCRRRWSRGNAGILSLGCWRARV